MIDLYKDYRAWHWRAKRITFRHYGDGKKRPMFHRFEVKGGVSLHDLMVENIMANNSLFRRLQRLK